jgi:hypothetical protein
MIKACFLAVTVLLIAEAKSAANKLISLPSFEMALADHYSDAREVKEIKEISVNDGIKLYLRQGTQQLVVAEASSAYLGEKIKTVEKKGTLKIYFDASDDPNWKGLVHSKEEFKVYITLPRLKTIEAADGAEIQIDKGFDSSEMLQINLFSGGKIKGRIKLDSLKMTMRGGSRAHIQGSANQLALRVTQGSQFKSDNLSIEHCQIFASGASQVQLDIKESIEAEAINEANIRYRGKGKIKKGTQTQGGRITHI